MSNTLKKILFFLTSLSLSTGTFFAQTVRLKKNHPANLNLSIWKNISTQPLDSLGTTYFNLGIYSTLNSLHGVGINIIGSTTHKDIRGIQIAGLSHMTGGNLNGLQIAGITNITGCNLTGASISGLIGITNGKIRGLSTSGLGNIYGSADGVIVSGLLNFGIHHVSGLNVTGIANVYGKSFTGLSSSGMLNVTGEKMKGIQLSGVANITGEDMKGMQIAGIGNVTGGTAIGAQIGLANMATHVKGLQIGLFNYYKESLKGLQLGLVNANPHTRIQLMLFGGNTTKLNIGVKFKNKLFYTILGGGSHHVYFNNKFSATAFYRAGMFFHLYKQLSLSGDIGYQHIETFKNKNYDIPPRLYALQARLNLEYQFCKTIGFFLTSGYGGSRPYTQNRTYEKGMLVEGGIILF